MSETDLIQEIDRLENELKTSKQRLAELRLQLPIQPVTNYTFTDPERRKVTLSELFGDRNELLIVHNMGKSCPYCTLWADGLNGVYFHIESKVPFVVSTPDSPDTIREFAASRNWKFKLVSTQGTSFKQDLGFEVDASYLPGVTSFKKDPDGKIYRVTQTLFGPGDDFCAVWPLFDLLPSGNEEWHPRFKYL